MQRVCPPKQQRCESHDFRLYPIDDAIYNGQYYNVSFCTCKQERSNKKNPKPQKYNKNITFPLFNHDHNYSTPAFILNSEKNYYESQGAKMKAQHEKKIEDYTQEKIEINIPKPRSKNNYCSVCKSNYDDYLDHINGDLHARKIHQSTFNKDILELSQKYQKDTQRKVRRVVKNIAEKTVSVTRIEDSDDVEIISNPHKQIKVNENLGGIDQMQLAQMQQSYLSNITRINPCPGFGAVNSVTATLNSVPLPLNQLPLANLSPVPLNGFKPFSSTYQQQMNQFILNLNIIFNPYPINSLIPQLNIFSPLEVMQAKQQLNLLQYSLMNQISFCNQLQSSLAGSSPPYANPHAHAQRPACIVIDE